MIKTRQRETTNDKRLNQTMIYRIATRRDILILLRLRDDNTDVVVYQSKRETLRAIKRSILSHTLIYDVFVKRDRLSNESYLVSILTSLSDQAIIDILIDLRDNNNLIHYAKLEDKK